LGHMENNSSTKKSDLFGFGTVMYGFTDLLVWHSKDFLTLLGHMFKDYLFEQYKPARTLVYVDTELENRIIPRSGALNSYLSLIPFFIGSLGFLKQQFGRKVRQDVHLYFRDLKNLFSDAGFVFENAPTRMKYRQSPSVGLKLLHFFDRPRNCFPSLHVILVAYSYLKTKELVSKYSADESAHAKADIFLRQWSLSIIESCLLTKQHGLRDIAGGLATISAKCPEFGQEDIKEIISLLFSEDSSSFSGDTVYLVKEEIKSVYAELINSINIQKGDYRSALVNYIRSI